MRQGLRGGAGGLRHQESRPLCPEKGGFRIPWVGYIKFSGVGEIQDQAPKPPHRRSVEL